MTKLLPAPSLRSLLWAMGLWLSIHGELWEARGASMEIIKDDDANITEVKNYSITLGFGGLYEQYKVTLKPKVGSSNIFWIDGDPALADGSAKIFFEKNGAMAKFSNLNQLPFVYHDGQIKVSIRPENYSTQLQEQAEKSYIGQLLVDLNANPQNVVTAQWAAFKQESGDERLEGKDCICGQGPNLGAKLDEVMNQNRFALAYRDEISNVTYNNKDASVAHLLAFKLQTMTPAQLAHDFYHPDKQRSIDSQLRTQQVLSDVLSFSGVFYTTLTLGIAFTVLTFANSLFQMLFKILYRQISAPSLIVYKNFPITFWEKLMFPLFGNPARLEDESGKMILSKSQKRKRKQLVHRIKYAVAYNKKLSSKQRAAGKGLGISSPLIYGPPGIGKTMYIESVAAKLEKEMKGYVHVIVVSGSEASKVPKDEVINVMNELDRVARKSYERDGTITLFVINETDSFLRNRFDPKVSQAQREITAKYLDMRSKANSPCFVVLGTSNLDIEEEKRKETKDKVMDFAAVDRFESIPFGEISNEEERSMFLYKVFMVHLRAEADKVGMKVRSDVDAYVKQRFSESTALGAKYPTPRQMNNFATKLVINIASESAKRKSRQKRITVDHMIKAFDEEVEGEESEASAFV